MAVVQRDTAGATARDSSRVPVMAIGTVVWLASEILFFGSLLGSWFTLRARARGDWPPAGAELDVPVTLAFTVALLASSVTMHRAVRSLEHDEPDGFRRWLALTAGLGAVFVAGQAIEWSRLDFGMSSHAYGSLFYLTTGFHGLHLLGGLVAMGVLLGRSATRRFGSGDLGQVEVVSYYWHFVDAVWVAIFLTIYVVS